MGVRNVVDVGNSRGVTLPADWLELMLRKFGAPVTEVILETADDCITIHAIDPHGPLAGDKPEKQ